MTDIKLSPSGMGAVHFNSVTIAQKPGVTSEGNVGADAAHLSGFSGQAGHLGDVDPHSILSNPHAGRHLVREQAKAAHILTGGHATKSDHQDGVEHNEGHGSALPGQHEAHVAKYVNKALHGAAEVPEFIAATKTARVVEALEGADAAGIVDDIAVSKGADTGKAVAESASEIEKSASVSVKKPFVPLKEPHGEMAEMIENMDRAGAFDDLQKPAKSVTQSAVPVAEQAAPVAQGKVGTGSKASEVVAEAATKGAHGRLVGKLHKFTKAADKVLGPAGVVFGAAEAVHGVDQIGKGKVVEGAANTVAGGATVVSGAAATATAFTSATTVAGVGLGALAAGSAGVAALADGVKDMYKGVKNHDVEKGVVGGVKSAAGTMMAVGAASANPLLIAGGAGVYVGALAYENREAIGEFAGKVADGVSTAAHKAVEWGGKAVDTAVEWGGKAADAVGGAVGTVVDGTRELAGEAADAFNSAWEWAFGG